MTAANTASVMADEATFEVSARHLHLVRDDEPTTETWATYVDDSIASPVHTADRSDAQSSIDRNFLEREWMLAEVGRGIEGLSAAHTAERFTNSFEIVPPGLGSRAATIILDLLRQVFGPTAYIGSIRLDWEEDAGPAQLVVRAHYAYPQDGDVDELVELHSEFLRRYVAEVPAASRQSIALESVPTE